MTTTTDAPTTAAPGGVRLPAPIEGERPTRGVPFTRLLRVELRKMFDTRAGRWLVIGIGVVVAGALGILLVRDGGDRPFEEYLQATTMPMAVLLPVVGILAVTSEWSQRTALATFTLEPRRARVAWAKTLAALVVAAGAVLCAFGLAALAHAAAIGLRGATGDWEIGSTVLLGAAGYVLLFLLQGVAFGMLLRNTPAAVVAFFVLPTAWSILGTLVSQVRTASEWLDLNRTMEPLFVGSISGEQWAQLGTSVAAWVVLPLAVGMWLTSRVEVK
ncbi:ABC transporter permease [Phycicoccus sp. BSK3Z-2]|uniref:ABC transporter permease n=1 Tax=Phycicoccus avicenniae TaxID=2828860 RepID=A0A941DCB8_9MICO|nr:ABC transporter permease [Phycicoccus avicenniae]MBR7744840.1 ABC transporter permease [Phycicoccus avicenniae]